MSAPTAPVPAPHGSLADLATGHFEAHLEEDLWSWSPGLVTLLGHETHPALATTELFLHHVLPTDRAAASELVAQAQDHPCAARVQARTVAGAPLTLLVTAQPRPCSPGSPRWLSTGITGSVTEVSGLARPCAGSAADLSGDPWLVEQARGVVMYTFRLGGDAALALLVHYARSRCSAVHQVAHEVLHACAAAPATGITRALVAAALAGEPRV